MKTNSVNLKLILLGLILLFSINSYAQKKAKKVKVYKVWVELANQTKQKGFLYAVDDTSIKIVSRKSLKDLSDVTTINVKDISKIYIKRRGKGWRSTLIGALGTAIAIEIMLYTDDPDSENSFFTNEALAGFTGFFFGAPIGALVGTGRKKFKIYGDEAVFKSKQEELIRYAMIKKFE